MASSLPGVAIHAKVATKPIGPHPGSPAQRRRRTTHRPRLTEGAARDVPRHGEAPPGADYSAPRSAGGPRMFPARPQTHNRSMRGRDPELRGIRRSFADLVAVNDLSFSVLAGQLFGFVGRNGAGKTTTMRIICGLLEADCGHGHVGRRAHRRAPPVSGSATCPRSGGSTRRCGSEISSSTSRFCTERHTRRGGLRPAKVAGPGSGSTTVRASALGSALSRQPAACSAGGRARTPNQTY